MLYNICPGMMCQKQLERAPCLLCIKFVKWLPVLFILAATVWSYYAYVVQLCILTVENDFTRALYLILYHVFFSIFLWSYWQTIFSEIAVVPKRFKLSPSDVDKLETAETEDAQKRFLENFARDLPVSCRNMSGGLRYCEKCQHVKPDRAHHCSVCGVCVLKMDHHCPWVNNCVAFHNYKFFILFLNYALLYCLYVALTVLPYFIQFFTHDLTGLGKFHILFLFFVAVMFAISLVSLFGYHCYLVALNRSTLEAFRAPVFSSGPDKNGFYLGKYNNFQEVFGDNKKKWFLPVFSSLGDGVFYPTSHRLPNTIVSYNTMVSTVASPISLGDGINFPQRLVDEDTDQLIGGRQRWTESGDHETVFAPPFQTPLANGNIDKNSYQESSLVNAKQINGMV